MAGRSSGAWHVVLADHVKGRGAPILIAPFDTPFGRTFVFQDPDGYAVAIHAARAW